MFLHKLTKRIQKELVKFKFSLWLESGLLALNREALREALEVIAVVVDHVLLLHPPQPVPSRRIQPLILPSGVPKGGGVVAAGFSGGPDAGVGVEVPVGGGERSLCPVGLHKPASRRPVVGVPQTRVDPHRLSLRIWNSGRFVVVENPNRNVVHQKAASIKSSHMTC